MDRIWDQPVIVVYREDREQPSREAVTVIRARRLTILHDEKSDALTGRIEDFFPLMGDIDSIHTGAQTSDRYILCIYGQGEKPFDQPDRVTGVIFPQRLSFIRDQRDKRTYHGSFRAERMYE